MKNSAFIFSDQQLTYKFNETHPFNPIRLEVTLDLLQTIKALNEENIIQPDPIEDSALERFHSPHYIAAVKKASEGHLTEEEAEIYGLGTEDTPTFKGMHSASSINVAATMKAADLVASGQVLHALNLGGGLHHGFSGKASGFCIYNDIAVAIKYLQEKYQLKVLYIDTDAHHGDGVQWGFYDDPNVCTFSIHETGRYLFPGTGYVSERGTGKGYGYSLNLPVDAFTEDASWLSVFKEAVSKVTEFFQPDIILSQHGVDAHYYDPLTHLSLTIESFKQMSKIIHQLAHQHCGGRWVAVGGGGYDHWRVVPRAWAYLWLCMNDREPESQSIPQSFIEKWESKAPHSLITTWDDPANLYPPIPRKQEITEINQETLAKLIHGLHLHQKFL